MENHFPDDYIRGEVAKVMHPTINCSLIELGIVKHIEIQTGRVIITMAFPFPNVPIEDFLIDSVKESIEEIDASMEIETGVMNKAELQKFLALEQEHWKKGA